MFVLAIICNALAFPLGFFIVAACMGEPPSSIAVWISCIIAFALAIICLIELVTGIKGLKARKQPRRKQIATTVVCGAGLFYNFCIVVFGLFVAISIEIAYYGVEFNTVMQLLANIFNKKV